MVTFIQPLKYIPVPIDILTAIERIVDHYLPEEEKDFRHNPGVEGHEHIAVWLTAVQRWSSEYHRHVAAPRDLPVIAGMRTNISLGLLMQGLGECRDREACLELLRSWLKYYFLWEDKPLEASHADADADDDDDNAPF